eukprot:UC1_evm1s490
MSLAGSGISCSKKQGAILTKTILKPGKKGDIPAYTKGCRADIHFVARRADTGAILDDSRKMGLGPFELRIGKAFVLR